MSIKDKIKAFAIASVTTILTSCGFGGGKEAKVEVRDNNQPAMGLPKTPQVKRTPEGFIDTHKMLFGDRVYTPDEWDKIVGRGDTASVQILDALKEAKIAVIKGDSVLHDVEMTKFDGKVELSNPHYALNRVKATLLPDNKEYIGGVTVAHKIDPKSVKSGIYRVDENTIGVKDWTTESVEKQINKVRKLVKDKDEEAKLQQGDTIIREGLDFGIIRVKPEKFVVEKDGVSPTEDVSYVETRDVTRITFDYKLDKESSVR